MRIIPWSKADLNIAMKINNIKQIIIKQKPQIQVINELNLNSKQYAGITNIPGYNFISDCFIKSQHNARIGMWITKNLKFTRNTDFVDNLNPIIAIKVGYSETNKN